MSWDTDKQFDESTVAEAVESSDGWLVKRDDGWSIFVPNTECSHAPSKGEAMRCYGKGIGFSVRGIAIAGRLYRYQTEEQEAQSRSDEEEKAKQEKRLAHAATKQEKDKRIALIPMFAERFNHFHAHGGDEWRAEFEPYELFVCEQASEIVSHLKSVDLLADFSNLSFVDQKALVPSWDEGHSWNTAGAAMLLARVTMTEPEKLPMVHGALCPLVGCESYKCFAATRKTAS